MYFQCHICIKVATKIQFGPAYCIPTGNTYRKKLLGLFKQCWTEGRSSTAVAEDLGPKATATVAEV